MKKATGQVRLRYINHFFKLEIMTPTQKHPTKKWEVSLMKYQNHTGMKYKVTRRIPELSVAETKVFASRKKAKQQFEEWLE